MFICFYYKNCRYFENMTISLTYNDDLTNDLINEIAICYHNTSIFKKDKYCIEITIKTYNF